MNKHLCVSVRLLDRLYHGSGDNKPEWPPNPLRLFQALVAGAYGGSRHSHQPEEKFAAFSWLEQQKLPSIIAPNAKLMSKYTRFAPRNDSDEDSYESRLISKVMHPHYLQGSDTLYYCWELPDVLSDDEVKHLNSIKGLARNVVSLGLGVDMAIGNACVLSDQEMKNLTGNHWRPSKSSNLRVNLRVPKVGTMKGLQSRHRDNLNRLAEGYYNRPSDFKTFNFVGYQCLSKSVTRPVAAFLLSSLKGSKNGRRFPQEQTVEVSAMIRHVACEVAKNDLSQWRTKEWAEQYVAGHGPRKPNGKFVDESWPRFYYLPLPTVGHDNADGMLRRVLIAGSLGEDNLSTDWIHHSLNGAVLKNKDGYDVARLEAVRPDDRVFRKYCVESSREWITVTPVILPGYDSNKPNKRARLLGRCLEYAGYDLASIESIESRKHSWHTATAFNDHHRSSYMKNLPACHVRIRFKEPTVGPVILGAGRYRGLGLFVAND